VNRQRRALLALAFVAVATADGTATFHRGQQFHAGVTVAVLDVVVTDSRGEPVPDLQRGDFEVLDNGTSREVVSARFVAAAADVSRERPRMYGATVNPGRRISSRSSWTT
jgi:hypothetical protein